MATISPTDPRSPDHPKHKRYRAICERMVNIRGSKRLTVRDRELLAELDSEREALWGAAAPTPPPTSRRSPKPTKVRSRTTRKAKKSAKPLSPRIEFKCANCRKKCWTVGRPEKFCDTCSDKFRGRTQNATHGNSGSTTPRLWIQMIPSGHPGSGLRHG